MSYIPMHLQGSFQYKNLDELKRNADLKIPESTPYSKCLTSMTKLSRLIEDERSKQHEEREFYYLHRYMKLFKHSESRKKVEQKARNRNLDLADVKLYFNRYEDLQKILQEKYEALNRNQNSKEIQLQPQPANAATNHSANNNKVSGWTLKTSYATGAIECNQLYALLNNQRAKELVILLDVRRSGDFAASHVKFENVANIPEEILTPGLSAQNLGKKLTGRSAELWEKRANADALVLLDWFSSSKSTNRHSAVFVLRNIIKQWDPLTAYKSPPILLEGGFEELLERYPQTVTNPKVDVPRRPDDSSVNPLVPDVDVLYPLEVLEPERPKTSLVPPPVIDETPPSVPRSAPAVVDRSNKPQLPPKDKDDQAGYQADPLADSLSEDESMDVDDVQTPAGDRTRDNTESFEQTLPPPLANSTVLQNKPNNEKTDKEDVQPENPPSRKPDPTEVENLRKLKPSSAPKSTSSQSTENSGISRVPLKKDGAPSGILRRTSSFPNMQQIRDDEPVGPTVPTFSRALKNVSPKKTFLYSDSDFHRPDATYGKTTPGLIGLKNFANNCYMNSIIQCLNNTEPLVKELVQFDSSRRQFNHTSRFRGRIAQEVIASFRNMWSGQMKIYSVRELKSLMGEVKDIFKGSAHQDSNEFLIILLEHLHEDLNMPAEVATLEGAVEETGEKAWGEFRRKNCSVIQRLFYGQHKSTVTCDECGHESATFEQFFNLFVPIPSQRNAVSLQDCIKSYMSGERISGWVCPNCKVERNATKKFDISRLPPVLVIALKRFAQEDESWLHKKENLVSYPLEDLDMIPFTVRGSEQRCRVYDLYAMSTHSGTTQSGHYRAICKSLSDNRWYMFDDQTVNQLSESSVRNNSEVYILFYIARTDS